jgi:hypothetical protein
MDRMLVISALEYSPPEPDASTFRVEDLGVSLVRLMQLSEGEATGVRANLQINDQAALNNLARHYAKNNRLEWTFDIGGGGGSFSVVLRWTKFDRLTGNLQVVRTAVLRDLISEAEQDDPDEQHSPSADRFDHSEERDTSPVQPSVAQAERSTPSSDGDLDRRSDDSERKMHLSKLLPGFLQKDGRLDFTG